MKKLIVVMLILSVASICFGVIVNTEGEQKIGQAIKSIYAQVDNTRNSIAVTYSTAKAYVTANPTQFTTDDKTKLNGLQAEITDTDTAIASLKAYIETNFPGLND